MWLLLFLTGCMGQLLYDAYGRYQREWREEIAEFLYNFTHRAWKRSRSLGARPAL